MLSFSSDQVMDGEAVGIDWPPTTALATGSSLHLETPVTKLFSVVVRAT